MSKKKYAGLKYGGPLKGLKGEVFSVDGRVAGSVPPLGVPGAVPFEILGEYPGQTPPWADMMVGKNAAGLVRPGLLMGGTVRTRIHPGICQAPFLRLFDCVSFVWQRLITEKEAPFPRFEEHLWMAVDFPPPPHPNSEKFAFTLGFNGRVVMIDLYERVKAHCQGPPQPSSW
jgi:hypothetical protein